MKIQNLFGREIFDSRGEPTIEATLVLEDGRYVTAAVPSGSSRGEFEAKELRDGGTRLGGRGVTNAIQILEQEIAPLFVNKEPDVVIMDSMLVGLDETPTKENIGGNTTLAASCAVLKAQALMNELEVYQMIAHLVGLDQVTIPHPMFNMINGGAHAANGLHVQEFLIVPVGMPSFRETMDAGTTFYQILKKVLQENNAITAVGDEGGFAPQIDSEDKIFALLNQAIERAEKTTQARYIIGLDVAASQFYNTEKKAYNWHGALLKADDLIEMYAQWADTYPVFSIEDGLSEHDSAGWKLMMDELGTSMQIVGDDLFATSPERIWRGVQDGLANAVLIKPNQIGTVTETLQAIGLCKENDLNVIASHRSGETNDPFIADLALGTNAGALKAGAPARGERLAKYNHLLRVEDDLTRSALSS